MLKSYPKTLVVAAMKTVYRSNWFWSVIPSPIQATFFYGLALTGLGLANQEPAWIVSGTLLLGMTLGWNTVLRLIRTARKQYGRTFDVSLRLAVAGALVTVYEAWTQKPAYAFLGRACAVLLKITNLAGENSAGQEQIGRLIRASIYIVRGLFLVYLAIAAVNVFKQMQSGEDWQTAVRAPLVAIILVAVVEGISFVVAPEAENTGC